METVIVSVICIALIVVGGMTMSQSFLSSVDSTALSFEKASQQNEEILRTDISTLSTLLASSTLLEVSLRNSGQTKLNDFARWDVIAQYFADGDIYHVSWLPYTSGIPGNNEWTVKGIYTDSVTETQEVFEPGIFNPGEEMKIRAILDPSVGRETTNLIIISTPNGISASATFIRN